MEKEKMASLKVPYKGIFCGKLRRYFSWARRTGLVEIDPAVALRAPSGEGRLPRVLDGPELQTLLEPIEVDETEPLWRRRRNDALLEVLYGSGLRVSELCNLDIDSVDRKRSVVTVWGKGGKERRVRHFPNLARGSVQTSRATQVCALGPARLHRTQRRATPRSRGAS